MAETVFLLLGSNLGDREKKLKAAREHLTEIEGLEIVATSGIYISEAMEMKGENPSFLNQAVKAEYQFLPNELLHSLEAIETQMGRTEKGQKKNRPIDIDILLFGDQIIESGSLAIPHPRLVKRPFALVPLLQIDSEVVHPVTGKPLSDYLTKSAADEVILFRDHVARSIGS